VREPVGYRIVDEPAPTALEQVIVNPVWPFLASMFAGAWLAYPWFVLNAFALGGRRRFLDLAIALGGLAASALSLFAYAILRDRMLLDESTLPYTLLLPVAVRLVSFYWLFMRQEQVFVLYTYFGGKTRNAMLVVVAASFLRSKLLGGAPLMLQALLG
jgi:hypothetical protein